MEFEKEFNISIPDEQAETITTVVRLSPTWKNMLSKRASCSAHKFVRSAFRKPLGLEGGFITYINYPRKVYMELKRVVVTGIGALTPLGNNLNDYWNGLLNGVSGADLLLFSMPRNSRPGLPAN